MLLRYDTKNAVAVVKDVTNIDTAECFRVFAINPGRDSLKSSSSLTVTVSTVTSEFSKVTVAITSGFRLVTGISTIPLLFVVRQRYALMKEYAILKIEVFLFPEIRFLNCTSSTLSELETATDDC